MPDITFVFAGVVIPLTIFVFIAILLLRAKPNQKEKTAIELFMSTMDQLKSSTLIIDVDTGQIIYANKCACDTLHYTKSEFNDLRIEELEVPDRVSMLRNHCYQLLESKQDQIIFDTVLRSKQRAGLPFEIFMQGVQEESRVRYFIAIMRDISERKRIEKLQNDMISTVSHELRTPLTSIRGSLGLLEGETIERLPERVKLLIDIAYKNSDRLMYLINDILDLEKIKLGEMRFKFEVVEIVNFIEQNLTNYEPFAAQHGQHIKFHLPSEKIYASIDRERISQVIANLISNAIKFSPNDGTISVAVESLGFSVKVSIIDEGEGIPGDMREKIFEKYVQIPGVHAEKNMPGSGLGLPISVAIIEAHGGLLSFESGEKEGSSFFFEIPTTTEAFLNSPNLTPQLEAIEE